MTAFLLLSTGHVWEVAEDYADITDQMTSGDEGELTVLGQPMFFRFAHVIAAAQTYEQVHVITLGVAPGAAP